MRNDIKILAGLTIIGTTMSISNVYADSQYGIVHASALNIRSGPSTSYKVINKVSRNSKLEILEKINHWYKVRLSNGTIGWASADYISTTEDSQNSNTTENMSGKKGQVKVSTSLNVRSGASTKYSVVAKLRNKEIVDLLEKNSGWYKVRLSNKREGWVSSDYINIYTGSDTSTTTNQTSKAQDIVKKAYEQLGKPYVWGAEGPNSFDCSGLVHYVFGQNGISTPRVSRDQYKFGKSISKSNLQPGDLIFSSTSSNKTVNHVGIYVGNGQMIHAPNSNGVVKKVDINTSYWNKVYVGAKRVI